jgi:hypothetical protein
MQGIVPKLLITASLLLGACGVEMIAPPPTPVPTAPPPTPVPLPPEAVQQIDGYIGLTRSLLAEFDGGASDDSLKVTANSLLDLSLAMLPNYLTVRPQCEAYFAATLEIAMIWDSLPLEDIERDYHRGEALPTSEVTTACEPMKDLIVHPATILALLSQDEVDRPRLRTEIATVGVQSEVVKQRP